MHWKQTTLPPALRYIMTVCPTCNSSECKSLVLRAAQVVLTEGDGGFVSRAVSRFTRSPWTHVFVVTRRGSGIEAYIPRVRTLSLCERLAELEREGRAWAVLEQPKLTLADRLAVASHAESYEGRRYAVWAALRYVFTREFREGASIDLVCSRLVTASYLLGAHINLFPGTVVDHFYEASDPHRDSVLKGWVAPKDLFRSSLQVLDFHPSKRIPSL